MGGFIGRMKKRIILLNAVVLGVLTLLVLMQYQHIPSKHVTHVGDDPQKVDKTYQGYKHWKPFNSKNFITIENLTQPKVEDGEHAFGKVNDTYDIEPRSPLQERHPLNGIPNKTDHRGMERSHGVLDRNPSRRRTLDVSDHYAIQSRVKLGHQRTHNSLGKGLPFSMSATEQIPGLFNYSLLKEGEERHPLVNLHQYQFTLNSDLCERGHVYLLTIVHSALDHFNYRRRIRETFGSVRNAWNKTVVLVFTVGVSDDETLQTSVVREANEFKDIIQGNFIDVYRNLSIKHIMGYHWMLNHCPEAAFVLKMDDDMFMNPYVIVKYLTQLKEPTNQMICTVFKGFIPQRKQNHKYHVPRTMYPFDVWPDFCQGFAYIVSRDLLSKLYDASSDTHFVVMDDVYVTGILRSLTGIKASGFGTLKTHCNRERNITISQLNSVGVIISYTTYIKHVFKTWNLISIYTDGSYHSSEDDKSSFIKLC
ncbi:beta-1,3-galactosyltransferase 1-like [Haliotis rubra]|uniref:beta-1,3-galactosyltransferase 1-like n=1 Tax=Haliotis rubra TaxID=36100 RepID=UPI001EE55044|nr:beta-1,3-galactosyltransferase 1-like [Haliotis rubra]